jgi:hypothetical protein
LYEGELRSGQLDESTAGRLGAHVLTLADYEDNRISGNGSGHRFGKACRRRGVDRRAARINDASRGNCRADSGQH